MQFLLLLITGTIALCTASITEATTNADSATRDAAQAQSPAQPGSMAPRLAQGPDGSVWLSWLEPVVDGHALKISRYNDGRFSSPITVRQGSDWVANWADTPHLYVGDNGWLVAQWLQKSAASTYAYDVILSYSTDGGANWSEPVAPHSDGTPTEHGFVSFFDHAQAAGLVWLDGRETAAGGPMTLRGGQLNRQGHMQQLVVLDERVCDCCQTGATVTNTGPVIVYRDRSTEEIRDIYLVQHTDQGWSEPMTVHQDHWKISGCPVNGPQIVSLGDEVAVVWYTMADNIPSVHLARSSDHITRFTPPHTLARATPLGRVAIASRNSTGRRHSDNNRPEHGNHIAVAWIEELNATAQLQLAWLDAETLKEINRITVADVPRGRASGFPALATIDDQLVIAWTGREKDSLKVHTTVKPWP